MAYDHMCVTKDESGRFISFAEEARRERNARMMEMLGVGLEDPQKWLDRCTDEIPNFQDVWEKIPDRPIPNNLWSWGWYSCLQAWWKNREITIDDLVATFGKAIQAYAVEFNYPLEETN